MTPLHAAPPPLSASAAVSSSAPPLLLAKAYHPKAAASCSFTVTAATPLRKGSARSRPKHFFSSQERRLHSGASCGICLLALDSFVPCCHFPLLVFILFLAPSCPVLAKLPGRADKNGGGGDYFVPFLSLIRCGSICSITQVLETAWMVIFLHTGRRLLGKCD
jgi:hypothetical protein